MRIVLIEPSHWHYAMYRDGIVRSGVQVVGVVDASAAIAAEVAAEYGCAAWPTLTSLLDATQPDFAFAFGAHAAMPAIALELVRRRIPFSIEKPCGMSVEDVAHIEALARQAGLFASVPFHYRLSALHDRLQQLTTLPSQDFLAWQFRINAGSPLRYTASSPWLVNRSLAGGGCMMNLAHHAIDLVVHCSGSSVESVSAQCSNKHLGLEVEDHAVLQLTMTDGSLATIVTGYSHPASPGSYMDFDIHVSHRDFVARRQNDALTVEPRGALPVSLGTSWAFKTYFAEYAFETLQCVAQGRLPIAQLRDLETTMRVVTAAYESDRTQAAVRLQSARPAMHQPHQTSHA